MCKGEGKWQSFGELASRGGNLGHWIREGERWSRVRQGGESRKRVKEGFREGSEQKVGREDPRGEEEWWGEGKTWGRSSRWGGGRPLLVGEWDLAEVADGGGWWGERREISSEREVDLEG